MIPRPDKTRPVPKPPLLKASDPTFHRLGLHANVMLAR